MYTIGIDIGGTKIKFGMFEEDGQPFKVQEIKTPKELIAESMIKTIIDMVQENDIQGIGVATAGIVDYQNGIITSAANLPSLVDVPLGKMLEKAFHVPVVVDNDANSGAVAEGAIGAAKTVRSFICVTIGTGIGGGIIHNNELVHGRSGYGGEIGHMTIVPKGLPCGCGRKGCWEVYASGKALERMISKNPYLKDYRPQDVFAKGAEKEPCKQIVKEYLEYLSIGIINLQYMFDPEMVVIGGGVIDSSTYWWDELVEKIASTSSIPINLQQAHLKNNASMIGANSLVKQM
ncbi:ROK family protein [Virgibacillus kekensis]|uniref:ROK family protein n=1 Tax=Virgibacillus kekensis TaxID=202261 RepID=A0ABV9DJF6_9BACI